MNDSGCMPITIEELDILVIYNLGQLQRLARIGHEISKPEITRELLNIAASMAIPCSMNMWGQ